jgi:hypothetical protein
MAVQVFGGGVAIALQCKPDESLATIQLLELVEFPPATPQGYPQAKKESDQSL